MWRSLLDQFPSPPVGSWILGHATNSMLGSTQAHRWFAEILLTHGKTVALRLLNRPVGNFGGINRWVEERIFTACVVLGPIMLNDSSFNCIKAELGQMIHRQPAEQSKSG